VLRIAHASGVTGAAPKSNSSFKRTPLHSPRYALHLSAAVPLNSGVSWHKSMSDNWLQFVPTDPEFQPSAMAAERARVLFSSFAPQSDEIVASFKNSTEFFHPGGNWSGVQCSACGANAKPWWSDAMDAASQNNFKNLTVVAQCCGANVSLNELKYVWPAAFGRFALEAMNPNLRDLAPDQESALSAAIGHSLRKVWVHL